MANKPKTITVTLELPESLIALLRTSFKIRGDRLRAHGASDAMLRRYSADPTLEDLILHSLGICAGMVIGEPPLLKKNNNEN